MSECTLFAKSCVKVAVDFQPLSKAMIVLAGRDVNAAVLLAKSVNIAMMPFQISRWKGIK
ncbi:MAG: hypothetical protein ACE5DZ_04790 [Mariprofundus sp.]